jgi:hypothetical protein
MGKNLTLSDSPNNSDVLLTNILRKKNKLYESIKKFAKQKGNDGVYAENIIRLALDGINLNHFHKNHPYVDIGINYGMSTLIDGKISQITQTNEILSIKSTINFTTTPKVLTDTKAVKIESLFSYVLFSHNDYETDYIETLNSPVTLLNLAIKYIIDNDINNVDYKKIVQITTYYLMYHNEAGIKNEFLKDIKSILSGNTIETVLKYGTYKFYNYEVMRSLIRLKTPISIGICYIDPKTKNDENTVCVIEKTEPMLLNKFWLRLLNKWCELDYFGKGVTKYLKYNDIFSIYDEKKSIKINIGTGDFKYGEDLSKLSKSEREKKVIDRIQRQRNKLYVATKFKDANFQDEEDNVVKTFSKIVDVLEDDPKLITKFDDFIINVKK